MRYQSEKTYCGDCMYVAECPDISNGGCRKFKEAYGFCEDCSGAIAFGEKAYQILHGLKCQDCALAWFEDQEVDTAC